MSKDKRLEVRLTEAEYNKVMELSAPFKSVAGWIRYILDNNVAVQTIKPAVQTKQFAVQTKEAKKAVLSSVTVQHSPTCQCLICKPF